MLEKNHLLIILEVERQGSLTAAANKLCLTQSALSHSVKKLEEQSGSLIWYREGRGLRLTQMGQYLLMVAKRILPQLDQAEKHMHQFSQGGRGTLSIGMECHPCYQWLLKVVSPYLTAWPDVDVDVKQRFTFGGIGALFNHEIDILVTPDPFYKTGLYFEPVFDYEQVLVVNTQHPLATLPFVDPAALSTEELITYPVDTDRLDIFNQFLWPAGIHPKRHKVIESTDIILQMVASGRGVTALPGWLVQEYALKMDITAVRLGPNGLAKQIHLGTRSTDAPIKYLQAFIQLARQISNTYPS